ncbi:hypothetical protein ABENE_20875 [Asticcacaulis benevestitus DSM 16100 = ATCC BAA-896]|uniref:Uncharacterized protein n=2 Tax=Asticcacaulis TaxID=76890 RepID=V4P680_9CAUL|nr:hypothetical protein ABENE_20875 [Asticcacaulis benevestitus DSM 16100 = ATCC BAA-896]
MRERSEGFMKLFAALFMALAISTVPALAQADPLDDHDAAGNLREFIIDYLKRHADPSFPEDRTIKVAIAPTSLGPRAPQGYVIYIRSGSWYGSGGCHTP